MPSLPSYNGEPVIIIGNGPVGATAALLLARWGMPVIVLDGRRERDLWVDPINEIEIAQRFIPRLHHHQDNLSSHLHRLQHPAFHS
jgi:2-polyprenyl-6-methoxyphenol hydroxylase-like FAD-dependent oxidoreductase